MATNYVIYDSKDTGMGMSAQTGPAYAWKNDWQAIGVASLQEFRDALDKLKREGARISHLLVTTHGGVGRIWFDNDSLDLNSVSTLAGKGYEDIFDQEARVFLDGCNVVDGKEGIKFLQKLGEIFFIKAPGSIGASTSTGLGGVGNPFNPGVYHLWGATIRLYFKAGPRLDTISMKVQW